MLFRVELKAVLTPTQNAVSNQLKATFGQSNKIVLDIQTYITRKNLINGLVAGVKANKHLISVLLIWKDKRVTFDREEILAKSIWEKIK